MPQQEEQKGHQQCHHCCPRCYLIIIIHSRPSLRLPTVRGTVQQQAVLPLQSCFNAVSSLTALAMSCIQWPWH